MIVILEDDDARQTIMQDCLSRLSPTQPAHFFKTADQTIDWFNAHLSETQFIALDHDLEMLEGDYPQQLIDPGTGRDVADYLATQNSVCPVIIHTTNFPAGVGMEMTLKEAGWKTKRVVPYGDLEWIPELWITSVKQLFYEFDVTQTLRKDVRFFERGSITVAELIGKFLHVLSLYPQSKRLLERAAGCLPKTIYPQLLIRLSEIRKQEFPGKLFVFHPIQPNASELQRLDRQVLFVINVIENFVQSKLR